jgi:Kef-type K+ transport system membrane component KefB
MIVGLLFDLSWPAAILMGSMWASNTLIAYSIIRTAGLTNNKAIATVVGATLITDTLALVVLSIVASAYGDAQGASGVGALLPILRLIIGFGVLVIYCLVLLPRIGRWFFAGPGQQRIQRFLFVLAALASAGLLAKLGGIEGLVGAFFAGVGLNRLRSQSAAPKRRTTDETG